MFGTDWHLLQEPPRAICEDQPPGSPAEVAPVVFRYNLGGGPLNILANLRAAMEVRGTEPELCQPLVMGPSSGNNIDGGGLDLLTFSTVGIPKWKALVDYGERFPLGGLLWVGLGNNTIYGYSETWQGAWACPLHERTP